MVEYHFLLTGVLDLHQRKHSLQNVLHLKPEIRSSRIQRPLMRDLFPYNLKRIELLLDIALLALNQGFLLNALLFLIPRTLMKNGFKTKPAFVMMV
ncbi:hypothetical protein P8452_07512 [Trifolium repens]|nr:hypothetical protein P8452_07512 [Trifolium repens]